MVPVTVSELADRYIKRELDNKEFCSSLNKLYWKRLSESQVNTILEFLADAIRQKQITKSEIEEIISSLKR